MSMTPYTFDLEPGQTKHQTFGEANFIFVDFADRELEVSINGSWQTLRKGTKFKSRTGMFDQFEIRNPDPNNPCRVVMFIGTDEIENLIVEGEIGIVPLLRNADGTTKPDTRFTLDLELFPSKLSTTSYQQWDIIRSIDVNPLVEADGEYFQGVYDGYVFMVGDAIGAAVTNNFANDGEVLVLDQDLNLVNTVDIQLDAEKQDSGWHPEYGYLTVEDADKTAIKQANLDNTYTPVFTQGQGYEISSFCWITSNNNLLVYHNAQGLIAEYSPSFILQRQIEIDPIAESRNTIRFDPVRQVVYLTTGQNNKIREFDYPSFAILSDRDNPNLASRNSFQPINQKVYSLSSSSAVPPGFSAQRFYEQALKDFDTKPVFKAFRSGCNVIDALYRSDVEPQVFADIQVEELPTGLRVSGELIRASLEFYFGRKMPDDYLDHVYFFDATRDGSGLNFKPVSSGNETFSRANVVDDFTTLLPGKLILTIDNELQPGGTL